MAQYLTIEGLTLYDTQIKAYADASAVAESAGAFKAVSYENGKLNFWTNINGTGTKAYSLDLPQEQFLDQTKTKLVQSFVWSEENYPGSTNPSLEGKSVLVLGVRSKGDSADTITYSFLDMSTLLTGINTFIGEIPEDSTSTTIIDYIDEKVDAVETEAITNAQINALFN